MTNDDLGKLWSVARYQDSWDAFVKTARAIESRALADREPIYQRMVGLDTQWVDTSKVEYEYTPVHKRRIVFIHPTPDDASDSARYRWLKANCFDTEEMAAGDAFAHPSLVFESDELQPYNSESLDAAIDAAMQADKEAK